MKCTFTEALTSGNTRLLVSLEVSLFQLYSRGSPLRKRIYQSLKAYRAGDTTPVFRTQHPKKLVFIDPSCLPRKKSRLVPEMEPVVTYPTHS